MLVVIAIVALLASVTVPATVSILSGSNINRAGQTISDQLSLARQQAVTLNRDVEIRFYFVTNGNFDGWRGLRTVRIDQTATGTATNTLTRFTILPDGVVIATNAGLSPVLTTLATQSENLPSYGSLSYRAFRFRANGSMDTSFGSNNYLTLVNIRDSGASPKNYYTIQINSLTGKLNAFRP